MLSAGIDVVASVELHPQPALTHAFNHPGTAVFVGDVRAFDAGSLLRHTRLQRLGDVDIVVGGPPCQGFSSAGKKSINDPRNSLFRAFEDLVATIRPRMFLLENVPGFQTMFGGAVYRQALTAFHELGYETSDSIISASDFGIPQTRRRFVLVGWLPKFVKPFEFPQGDAELVTSGDALSDIDFLAPGYEATRYKRGRVIPAFGAARRTANGLLFNHLASRHRARAVEIMRGIPVGGTIRSVDPAVRSAKRTMARLDRGAIANTVLSLPDDMIHYKHDRILTVRENARLQTFDDDFVFFGKRTSGFIERRVDVPQYTQVGNAVPPLLGKALGEALAACFGADVHDLRDKDVRMTRHALVRGSSGYAGYVLGPEAEDEIRLLSVDGAPLPLPVDASEQRVKDAPSLRDWTQAPRPRRSQWAPGVQPKPQPAWVAET